MKSKFKKQLDSYLLKNSGGDARVLATGVGSLAVLRMVSTILPAFIHQVLYLPAYPPFFLPDQYGGRSFYVWIAYLICGIFVGKIAKKFPVLFAVGAGFIFAFLYISFCEQLFLPTAYLYKVFAAQEFLAIIFFTGIGGLIGKALQKKKK